jgi:cobalt-zinc-cadmium efflux system outer membrane protein
MRRVVPIALLLVCAASCVPRDAGYQDIRRDLRARTRADAGWRHIDGPSVAEKRTRELLSKPLTASAAVQIALYNNQQVQAAFEELGVARAGVVEAFRLPNPTLEGALHFHGGSEPDVDLSVMQSVSHLLFLPVRNAAARAELDAAKLAVVGQVMDLALEVRLRYYRYQAAEQVAELRRTVLLAAKASYDVSRSLHEAGNTTDLDYFNAQALYEEARLATAQAEADVFDEREQLGASMGLWGRDTAWSAAGRLPDPPQREIDTSVIERRALERSLDLELARRRFAAAAKRANLARAEGVLPELKAGVSLERDEGEWGVGPAAELEVPIFYQGQGEVDRARSEMRRSASEHSTLAVRIRAISRAAAARLEHSRARALYFKRVILPLRERIVNETQLQFNAMSAGAFQLLAAKRDQVEAGRAYVEALRDYWIARAELDQLLAGRLVRTTSRPASPAMPAASSGSH